MSKQENKKFSVSVQEHFLFVATDNVAQQMTYVGETRSLLYDLASSTPHRMSLSSG
jgi:hypothetical protein